MDHDITKNFNVYPWHPRVAGSYYSGCMSARMKHILNKNNPKSARMSACEWRGQRRLFASLVRFGKVTLQVVTVPLIQALRDQENEDQPAGHRWTHNFWIRMNTTNMDWHNWLCCISGKHKQGSSQIAQKLPSKSAFLHITDGRSE
jgi:hypothetical protein